MTGAGLNESADTGKTRPDGPVGQKPFLQAKLSLSPAPVGIFLLGLLVRLFYLFESSSQPWFGIPVMDSRYILAQAEYLLNRGNFPPGPFFRPPLYTLLVAVIRKSSGEQVMFGVALVQHILGAVFCLMCWWIAKTCWTRRAGAIAGIAAALYAPLVFYEGEMLSDTLAMFLYGGFLVFWIGGRLYRQSVPYFLAGVFAGLGAITRPNITLVIIPFILIALLMDLRRFRRSTAFTEGPNVQRAGFRACMFPLLCLLVFGAITAIPSIRNLREGDFNFVASQGGINLYVGNGSHANGLNAVVPREYETSGEYVDVVEEYAVRGAGGAAKSPSEISSFWTRKTLEEMRSNRQHTALVWRNKLIAIFNNCEVRNNKDFSFVRKHLSRFLSLEPLTFGIVFPFFVIGIFAALRRSATTRPVYSGQLGWVIAYGFITTVGIMMFFVAGRLRLPLLPFTFVLAGVGLDYALTSEWFSIRRRSPYYTLIIGLIFLSIYHYPGFDFRYLVTQPGGNGIHDTAYYPAEFAVTAVACLENGQSRRAERFALQAVKADPNFSYGHLVLGNALYEQTKLRAAAYSFRKAHELDPSSARPLANLGVVAMDLEQTTVAVSLFREALARSPENATALANMAALQLRAGDREGALELARKALTEVPAQPLANAIVCIDQGMSVFPSPKAEPFVKQLMSAGAVNPSIFNARVPLQECLDSLAPQVAEQSR